MIAPSCPITNYKIISAVRNEIASRLDIGFAPRILALTLTLKSSTCVTEHMLRKSYAFSYLKLLFGKDRMALSAYLQHCRDLGIRRPRNKYTTSALRKERKGSRKGCYVKMIRLTEKLIIQRDDIHRKTANYQKRLFHNQKGFLYRKRNSLRGKISDHVSV